MPSRSLRVSTPAGGRDWPMAIREMDDELAWWRGGWVTFNKRSRTRRMNIDGRARIPGHGRPVARRNRWLVS